MASEEIGSLSVRIEANMRNFNDGLNQVSNKLGNMTKTAAKWGAGIAAGAAVAGGAIIALAAPLAKAAAEAQALNSQFEQVFKDMQGDAQDVVDELADDFGMLSNRIKPSYTQATSMFKGLGLETEVAMKTAKDAVTLAADAAAFYDKSYEDANGALNSFIKGNYEGGESIGLFANETQLAAYASKELGTNWKGLDEAGKQLVRIDYAQAMQKLAGATGQASRESDSLENKLGNLKQAWTDLKAKFGDPILKPAIDGLTFLTNKITSLDTTKLVDGFNNIKLALTKTSNFITPFVDNMMLSLKSLVGGIKALFRGDIENAFEYFDEVISYTFGDSKIYKIFSEFIAKFGDLFNSISNFITSFVDYTKRIVGKFIDWSKRIWDKYGEDIIAVFKTTFGFIGALFKGALTLITDLFNVFAALFRGDWKGVWEGIKTLFSNYWENIKNVFGKALDFLKSALKLFGKVYIDIWAGIWGKVKETAQNIWNSITNFFTVTIPQKFEELVTFFSELPRKIGEFLIDLFTVKIPYYIGYGLGYAISALKEGIPKIIQFFKDLPSNIATWLIETLNKFISWGSDMIVKAGEIGKNIIDGIIKFIKELPSKIAEWFKKVVAKIIDFKSGAKDAGKDFGKSIVDGVIEFIKELPGKIFGFFSDIVEGTKKFFDNIKEGFEASTNSFENGYSSGESYGGTPKFAKGTNFVPFDTQAIIHKGEAVVPADNNPSNPNAKNPIGTGVTNVFNIASMNVRDDGDIKLIAKELYNLQQGRNRGSGVFAT